MTAVMEGVLIDRLLSSVWWEAGVDSSAPVSAGGWRHVRRDSAAEAQTAEPHTAETHTAGPTRHSGDALQVLTLTMCLGSARLALAATAGDLVCNDQTDKAHSTLLLEAI